jgi:hypothetical protein
MYVSHQDAMIGPPLRQSCSTLRRNVVKRQLNSFGQSLRPSVHTHKTTREQLSIFG